MTDCIQDTIAAPSGLMIPQIQLDKEKKSEEENWSFQSSLFFYPAGRFCLSLFSLLLYSLLLLRFILWPELWRLLSPSAFAPRIALKPEIQDPDANLDK